MEASSSTFDAALSLPVDSGMHFTDVGLYSSSGNLGWCVGSQPELPLLRASRQVSTQSPLCGRGGVYC